MTPPKLIGRGLHALVLHVGTESVTFSVPTSRMGPNRQRLFKIAERLFVALSNDTALDLSDVPDVPTRLVRREVPHG